jgi:hypothetical protein
MNKIALVQDPEIKNTRKCTDLEHNLAQMLLAPDTISAQTRAHFDECGHCRAELEKLRATTALMDSWKVAEPSPYFLSRLEARIREEQQAAPSKWRWFARWRDHYAYESTTSLRPIAAMALTIMLLLGGGVYLGITNWDQAPQPQGQASVVRDLQTMENNAQLLDQLEALSSPSESEN